MTSLPKSRLKSKAPIKYPVLNERGSTVEPGKLAILIGTKNGGHQLENKHQPINECWCLTQRTDDRSMEPRRLFL